MKTKPPAMPLYVRDFLQSKRVRRMTQEQIGFFTLLLCEAWDSDPVGYLPIGFEPWQLARTMSPEDFDSRGGRFVMECFDTDPNGRLFSARQVAIREEQLRHSEVRSKSGARGAKARWRGAGKPDSKRAGKVDSKSDSKADGEVDSKSDSKADGEVVASECPSSAFSVPRLAPGTNSLTNAPRPNEQAEQFFHVLGFNSVLEQGVEEGTAFLVKRWVDDGCPSYLPDLVSLLDEALTAAKVQSIKTGAIFWQRLHKLRDMLPKQRRMNDEELLQHFYASQRSGSA